MQETKERIKLFGLLHSDIINKMIHKKYYYHSTGAYLNYLLSDIPAANKIYWDEILLRAHFASITSIMRNEKWLNGIILSIESSNFILFAASLRGFLESVTDSYFSLSTPLDLACNYKNIKLAVNGELSRLMQSKDLEEKLIHFQYATKADRSGLEYNKPLFASKYIDVFDKNSEIKTKKLYADLCEVVHPAQNSITCFKRLERESEEFEYSITDTKLDDQYIDDILINYDQEINDLLKMAIYAPVLCLRILNYFDYDLVKSEYLESCKIYNLLSKDVWHQVLEMIEKSYEN